MFHPPTIPISQTGHAGVRNPVLLSLVHHHSSRVPDRASVETRLVYFQGMAMTSGGLIYLEPGKFTTGDFSWFSLREAEDAVGAFIAVFEECGSGDLIVFGDFHGFQRIFYSEHGDQGGLLVSDALMPLVQRLRDSGSRVMVDRPSLIAQYNSFNALFNHHSFSTQTLVSGVSALRPDQLLRVSARGVKLETRKHFSDPRGRSYEQLILDAVSRGAEFVSASLQWAVSDRVLFLSGGRDSRSILAMAIAGGVEGQYPVYAKPPPSGATTFSQKLSLDRQLSGRLIEAYGLDLWEDDTTVRLSNSGLEREWWMSHWAGTLHDYNIPQFGSLAPSIRLIGAMGANFRTKVPDFVGHMSGVDFKMTESSFEEDFEKFFAHACLRLRGAEDESWMSVRDRFHDSLVYEGVGGALWERLDAFSEMYRMPAHFGGTAVEQSLNTWNLNILALPELTHAASLLSREERSAGKVWKDLHDSVDRRLNEIPYEFEAVGPDGGYLDVDYGGSRVDWSALDSLHSRNAERNARSVSHYRDGGSPRRDQLHSARLLSKLEDVLVPTIGEARLRYLKGRVEDRSILMKRLRGKLEFLDEVVDPQIVWSFVDVRIRSAQS